MMTINGNFFGFKSAKSFVANDDDADACMTSENDVICPPSWIDKLEFSEIRFFLHITPKPNRSGLKGFK